MVVDETAFDFFPAIIQKEPVVGHYAVGLIFTTVRRVESDDLMALVYDNAPNALARMHKFESLIDVL